MREILFRGKAKGKWFFGDITEWPLGEFQIWTKTREDGGHNYMIGPATVGQFTGLLDKNGKRIFEGDIVISYLMNTRTKVKFQRYTVDSDNFSASFSLTGIKDGDFIPRFTELAAKYLEVIGNIHDNPELLGKEDVE